MFDFEIKNSEGVVVDRINPSLFVATGGDEARLISLRAAMLARYNLTTTLNELVEDHQKMPSVESVDYMRKVATNITEVGYQIQELWHSTRDERAHMRWNLPGCSCAVGSVAPADDCGLHGDRDAAIAGIYKLLESKRYQKHVSASDALSARFPPKSVIIRYAGKATGQCHGAVILSYSDDGQWLHMVRISDDEAMGESSRSFWYTVEEFTQKWLIEGQHTVYRNAGGPDFLKHPDLSKLFAHD